MEVVTTSNGLKILITRLNEIGDCVATMPLACALRRAFPDVRIGWAVESPAKQLLESHPAVDELFVVPRNLVQRPQQLLELRKQLLEFRPTVSLDPQSLTKSSFVAWLSGARQRIGLERPQGREIGPLLNNVRVQSREFHIVDRTMELLDPLGVDSPQVEFNLPVSERASTMVEGYCRQSHLGCGFVLMNPGAGWASRRWPVRRFGAVARYLGQQYQVPTVVAWAEGEEEEMAQAIVQKSGGHALKAPRTSLVELAELTRKSRFYLGCDTGPMHIAAAVGTPCITMHGPTLATHSGAYGEGHITVQAFYQDSERKTSSAAMNAIQVEHVIRACDEMLARQGQRKINEAA